MKLTIKTSAVALILGLTPMGLMAQEGMDANGDGVFSYDEMLVAIPELTEETFIAIDVSGDGLVDPEEYAAAQEAGLVPADES